VEETAPGDAPDVTGDVGHFGIGGRFVAGGPMDTDDDGGGGVGVAFCSSILIRPSLLF